MPGPSLGFAQDGFLCLIFLGDPQLGCGAWCPPYGFLLYVPHFTCLERQVWIDETNMTNFTQRAMLEKDYFIFTSGDMKILLDSNYEILFFWPKSDIFLSFLGKNLSATSYRVTVCWEGLIKNLKKTEVGPLQGGLACFRDSKTPKQEILSNREHYKIFSKTEIFTSKSWIFSNKKT